MTVRNQILSLVDEQLVAGTFYYHYSIEMHNRGCYISHAFPNPPEHVMFILRPNVLLSVGSTKKKISKADGRGNPKGKNDGTKEDATPQSINDRPL